MPTSNEGKAVGLRPLHFQVHFAPNSLSSPKTRVTKYLIQEMQASEAKFITVHGDRDSWTIVFVSEILKIILLYGRDDKRPCQAEVKHDEHGQVDAK